ncbi:hypothetical protein EV649_1375 [Kribbella sp. VKM Ac-2569]|uniref:hypothetical protein n=1 Tax=Kribbella sp. VKM Ac-2569 TaxID=2512220 RepID=UPI0010F1941B|nr:hypothetical protein [Kribbella sp. VKM Ac-2569]RZT27605.1 hypothetical protein EV649_1375 [Kribbella sp. VKM Ac-2569]
MTADARNPVAAALAAVEQIVRQLASQVDEAPRYGVSSLNVVAALTELRVVQDRLATWEPLLIGAARDQGVSWADLAPALGVASRQAAERRYLRLNSHSTDQADMTGEQRVQAARDRRAGERAVTQWARDNAAHLRRLAAQITALDDLDATTQESVDRLLHALGDNDTATLLAPLAEAGAQLENSNPNLAGQVADINVTTNQLRDDHKSRTQ